MKKVDYQKSQLKEDEKKYKEFFSIIKQSKIPSKIKLLRRKRLRTVKCPLCDTELSVGAKYT